MRHLTLTVVLALAALTRGAAADDAARPLEACPSAPPLVLAASEPGSKAVVCCLIDTPEGCTGCGQGSSCVYQKMEEHQCVYVVYGTKCDDASLCR
ncbi:MAG TPA: hypothetical protein VMW35_01860 [Myxococcota bacterium]|jgi:hypothetical protein|nr:hypothetical protein [Myxococcota bacterium]